MSSAKVLWAGVISKAARIASQESWCRWNHKTNLFIFGGNNNRIFFCGGGTAYGFSAERIGASRGASAYDVEILGMMFKNKINVAGLLNENKVGGKLRTQIHEIRESKQGTTKSKTVAFMLSDPEGGYFFDVELLFDKEYGTPLKP
eukprot:1596072-Rhodomonas_salina.3